MRQFNGDITVSEMKINDYQSGDTNPVPLLYQSGYLTITGFNARKRRYNLGFPNEEVKYGFLGNLLPYYIRADADKTNYYVGNLSDTFEAGDLEGFFKQLRAFFGLIPYDLQYEKTESYYQTIFFVVFVLMGQFIETEVRSAAQRDALSLGVSRNSTSCFCETPRIVVDAVVKTKDTVYVFEFKLDKGGTVEEALKQIDDRGYLIPYSAEGRRLVKVGVVFDTEKRTIGEWAVVAAPTMAAPTMAAPTMAAQK